MRPDPEFDLGVLKSFVGELDPFLKSDVVFWKIGGRAVAGRQMPMLSLGGLQLTRRILAAGRSRLTPAQLTDYAQLDRQAEEFLAHWPANVEKKALSEIRSRLNIWASALDECGDNPAACAENYHTNVNSRVYVALLWPLVQSSPATAKHRQRLSTLDSRLRGIFISGGLVWDPALASQFPREEFWFLYGRPRVKKD